jgi:hypothetical protein
MKLKLSFIVFLFCLLGWSQPPVITGDLMLCPFDTGTAQITENITYDSYQWYYKYWFVEDDFEAIDGATEATFVYDWMTYDQALLKVVVTLGGETFESNTIQIDSYVWASLVVMYDLGENVTIDGETGDLLMCQGTSLELNVNMPYTNVEWYKDGELIEGANQMSYTLTQAGVYHAEAAPEMCPNSKSTSMPIIVHLIDCELSTGNPNYDAVKMYPNPVNDFLYIDHADSMNLSDYTIFDHTGRTIKTGQMSTTTEGISFEGLSAGIYLVNIQGEDYNATHKIVKK